MRSIVIFLLLACMTGKGAVAVSQNSSAATLSTDNASIKPSVLVGGQVQKPGRYAWFPGMTVVDALNAAGGLHRSTGHLVLITHCDNSRILFHGDTFPYSTMKPLLVNAGDAISVQAERPSPAPAVAQSIWSIQQPAVSL